MTPKSWYGRQAEERKSLSGEGLKAKRARKKRKFPSSRHAASDARLDSQIEEGGSTRQHRGRLLFLEVDGRRHSIGGRVSSRSEEEAVGAQSRLI